MKARAILSRVWPAINPPSDIPILAGAILLALSGVTHYWYDEAFTALLSRLPSLGDAVQATALDVHPPLHYAITWLLAHALTGRQEFVTRGISAVFQMLALITFWHILTSLKLDRNVKIASLALMAFAPVQLIFGAEGRMYALLQLLVLVQVWAMLNRRWWVLGLATAGSLYTHNYAIFYTAVIGMIALARELTGTCQHPPLLKGYFPDWPELPKSNFKGLMLAFALPALAYLPWVFYALLPQLRFVGSGQHWLRPLTPGQAVWDLFMIVQTTNYPKIFAAVVFMAVLAGMVLSVISAINDRSWLLLAMSFGPWVLACLGSWLFVPMMLFRGLLASTPFIGVLIIKAIVKASPTWKQFGVVLLLFCWAIGTIGLLGDVFRNAIHGESLDPTYPFPPGSTVAFMEDTSLVTFSAYPQIGVKYVYLDIDCGEQLGALGSQLRTQIGFETVKIWELPQNYFLVGVVSALANQCQEDVFRKMTSLSLPLVELNNQFGLAGIYYVGNP
jgi:hypothetical protein